MNESPLDIDCFASKADGPETELRVKGSRFVGQCLRADSEAEAARKLGQIKKRYHDATHHCSAYRLGRPGSPAVQRFDDDGEPSGTAGAPILAVVEHDALFDVLVVVTRYYGGTKLGTGGLGRAYGESARLAVDGAPERTVWLHRRLSLSCDYDDVGAVEASLARLAGDIVQVERQFDAAPSMSLLVRRSRAQSVVDALREATAGRVNAVVEEDERA